jgi:cytidylate kinase
MCVPKTVAIDGPAGSGKSTLGKMLAEYLGYLFFDTGAMYRAVTLVALLEGLDLTDEDAMNRLVERIIIDVKPPSKNDGRSSDVLVDGNDVTWDIRHPEVDANVSLVSAYPRVRDALGKQQRRIGSQGKVVMIGRDIGTVILPEAELKIYLDASIEERARRRFAELLQRRDAVTQKEILETMRERDLIDSTRQIAPLVPAKDAVVVDTDGLNIQEAFEFIKNLADSHCD